MNDVLRPSERVDFGSLGRASLHDTGSVGEEAESEIRPRTSLPIHQLRSEARIARTLQWIALASFALLIMTNLIQVALLLFAGVLVAVPLRAASASIARHLNISQGVALALVFIAITSILVAFGWVLVPRIAEQAGQVIEQLPEKWRQLQDRFAILGGAHILDQFSDPSRATIRAWIGKSFGAVSGLSAHWGALSSSCSSGFMSPQAPDYTSTASSGSSEYAIERGRVMFCRRSATLFSGGCSGSWLQWR